MRVFLTGATGFLGYNIALSCLANGHELLFLKRNLSQSSFDLIEENSVSWVNVDVDGWEEKVRIFAPQVLIHAAWEGVSAIDRNKEDIQKKNVLMSKHLMRIFEYKQIIMLGSQDEYGYIDSIVSEDYPINPLSAYARAKISSCKALQEYAYTNNIEWQWIRVFSIYGPKQTPNWLIPMVVLKCLHNNETMNTTKGEQAYAYLFSIDFANAIVSMLGKQGKSGIYNISSSDVIMLKDLFFEIKKLTKSNIQFNFGSLEYRPNQSMLLQGDCSKFKRTFGHFEKTSLSEGLQVIVESLKDKY